MNFIRNNLRRLGTLLSAALLVAAIAPSNVWRCLDGRLCPMGGVMPHAQVSQVKQPIGETHSCCHPAPAVASSDAPVLLSGMRCVLTHTATPTASLTRFMLPLKSFDSVAALAPSPTPVSIGHRQADRIVLSADLPPPICQESHLGRSPPVRTS